MEIAIASSNFLNHLRVERGLADNSISAYRRDLHQFEVFLQERDLALDGVTPKVIVEFRNFLLQKGLAETSLQRALSTLRTFYHYLSREEGVIDPTGDLEKSKQSRRLPKALTVAEVISLINAAEREGDPVTLRDRALLELLYGSGARISELLNLDLVDVHQFAETETETLKLRGKGGKERIVPLGRFASAALRDYLVRVRPQLAAKSIRPTNALFLNRKGTRLSRQSAWQFIFDAAKSAGIDAKVSPHVFRHSYATHLLDGGADIRVVQELLGHASVTTTQIYTLITIDKVRETYSLAHPRART
jgi:integrase/recombinase XerD